MTVIGGTAQVQAPFRHTPPPQETSVGRVEITDGYKHDEVPRIFTADEVDEGDEASSSEDEEVRLVARSLRRIRGCLPDCDCERRRGRKCVCERTLGQCGEACGCDKTKCRTIVACSDDDNQ